MTPNSTPNTTKQNSVTVQQAALILGISDEAVRARIRRGKLTGEKRGATWVVHLPDEAGHETTQRDTTHHVTRHPTQPTEQTQQNTLGEPDALVEHLQGEITYLRSRLEDAMTQLSEERRRADVLMLTASAGTRQEAAESPRSDETAPRRVVAWVRRLWSGKGR